MNTYYTKNADGTFSEVLIDSTEAVSIIKTNLINEALAQTTKLVTDCVAGLVQDKIKPAIDEHMGTINIADIVDDQVTRAVQEYDYDRIVESAADEVDIDELVNDKVRDHLDSCCIQVRIS